MHAFKLQDEQIRKGKVAMTSGGPQLRHMEMTQNSEELVIQTAPPTKKLPLRRKRKNYETAPELDSTRSQVRIIISYLLCLLFYQYESFNHNLYTLSRKPLMQLHLK